MIQVIEEILPDLERKLLYIRRFIQEGCGDADVRALAHRILQNAGPTQVSYRDPWSVARALYDWTQAHVPFERDPVTGEVADLGGSVVAGPVDLIQNAAATLQRGSGDCVALTVLLGSLVCVAGLPVRVGLQDTEGRGIDHVLLLVGLTIRDPQEWLPLDLTAEHAGDLRPGVGLVEMIEL
ncbi:MAG: hypothetical protein HY713_00700 [candidate division NC10 bacterium]|nr:hypothetical protein [candidate division NC10 bacterium]